MTSFFDLRTLDLFSKSKYYYIKVGDKLGQEKSKKDAN